MSREQSAHIQPSKHSTVEVDTFLAEVQHNVDVVPDAGSPSIMPNTDLDEDGNPATDAPKNPRI
jgi:hypothetical protein